MNENREGPNITQDNFKFSKRIKFVLIFSVLDAAIHLTAISWELVQGMLLGRTSLGVIIFFLLVNAQLIGAMALWNRHAWGGKVLAFLYSLRFIRIISPWGYFNFSYGLNFYLDVHIDQIIIGVNTVSIFILLCLQQMNSRKRQLSGVVAHA